MLPKVRKHMLLDNLSLIVTATSANTSSTTGDGSSEEEDIYSTETLRNQINEYYQIYKYYNTSCVTVSHNTPTTSTNTSSETYYQQQLQHPTQLLKSYLTNSQRIQLFPRLLMARYDSIVDIRNIAKSLFESIYTAKQQKEYILLYQTDVIQYLLSHLEVKNWRERYSAGLALETVLSSIVNSLSSNNNNHNQTSTTSTPSATKTACWEFLLSTQQDNTSNTTNTTTSTNHSTNTTNVILHSLWDKTALLMDDVYEQCRSAGVNLMKTLHDFILLPACTNNNNTTTSGGDTGKQQQQVLTWRQETYISFLITKLLDRGLVSSCQELKGFSFGVLIKLIAATKRSLNQYQVQLIAVMVECMSAFEPSMLQYMQFHTSRLNITDEAMEKTRLAISQQSPMQEALDILLVHLDVKLLPRVVYELTAQYTAGVGLATRVTAIQSIARLAGEWLLRVFMILYLLPLLLLFYLLISCIGF